MGRHVYSRQDWGEPVLNYLFCMVHNFVCESIIESCIQPVDSSWDKIAVIINCINLTKIHLMFNFKIHLMYCRIDVLLIVQ